MGGEGEVRGGGCEGVAGSSVTAPDHTDTFAFGFSRNNDPRFPPFLPQSSRIARRPSSARGRPIRRWLWTARWCSTAWCRETPPPPFCGGRTASWCPRTTPGSSSWTRERCRSATQRYKAKWPAGRCSALLQSLQINNEIQQQEMMLLRQGLNQWCSTGTHRFPMTHFSIFSEPLVLPYITPITITVVAHTCRSRRSHSQLCPPVTFLQNDIQTADCATANGASVQWSRSHWIH